MAESCWKTIGVEGDGSCPKLVELSHCRNCEVYIRAGRALLDREVPLDVRERWTTLLAEPAKTPGETVSLMVFRVADEWLALSLSSLEQVVEERPVHAVPGRSNRSFRGLVNIDGSLLLCFSAARLLGLQEEGTPKRMLVAAKGSDRIAFSADEILGVVRVPAQDLSDPPATVAHAPSALTRAVFTQNGRSVGVLDTDRWLQSAARSLA